MRADAYNPWTIATVGSGFAMREEGIHAAVRPTLAPITVSETTHPADVLRKLVEACIEASDIR